MIILHIESEGKGYFKAEVEGIEAGRMTYTKAGESKVIIDHTEVNADFSGKGVGLKLVLAAVEYARNNNFKIIPLCPFAKSVFVKKEELADVWLKI